MKIYCDTNVVLSAFITKGTSFDVLNDALFKHTVYYSEFMLQEFERILSTKFKIPRKMVNEHLLFVRDNFTQGKSAPNVLNLCKDKDDNVILSDCLMNAIELFITGDKELLGLREIDGLKIIAPCEYWHIR